MFYNKMRKCLHAMPRVLFDTKDSVAAEPKHILVWVVMCLIEILEESDPVPFCFVGI